MIKEIRNLIFPVAILIIGLSGLLVWQNLQTDALGNEIFVATENNYVAPATGTGSISTGSGSTSTGTTSSGSVVVTPSETITAEPLGSINNPYTNLSEALLVVTPGDTIYLRGGTYEAMVSDDFAINNINGTIENPILITNYNNEEVIIDGQGGTFAWDILNIIDSSNIVISGVEIINNPQNSGINVYSSENITLRDIEVSNNNITGIVVALSDKVNIFGNIIYNNVVSNIYVNNSTRVNINGNHIYSESLVGDGIVLSNESNQPSSYLDYIVISNNIIGNGLNYGITYDGIAGTFSNVRIFYNNIIGQQSEAIYFEEGSNGSNRVVNNIIFDGSSTGNSLSIASSDVSDFEFSNNVWQSGFPTIGVHNDSYVVDPSFNTESTSSVLSNRLLDSSPIIGFGRVIYSVSTDYFGTTRSNTNPTPGVYEPFASIETEETVAGWNQTSNVTTSENIIENNASLIASLAANENPQTSSNQSRWDASQAGWGKGAYNDYNTGGDDFISDGSNDDNNGSGDGSGNGDEDTDSGETNGIDSETSGSGIQADLLNFGTNGNNILILCLCLCLIPFILLLLLFLLLTSRDRERNDRGEYIEA